MKIRGAFVLFMVLSLLNGCTRDDICAEGTSTTPQLIILFRDIANPTQRKAVPNLTVKTAALNDQTILLETTTDSIAIPLNPGAEIVLYQFIENANGSNPNSDYLEFTYDTENLYVNRACGYKSVYSNLISDVQQEGSANWIVRADTLTTTITNENEAHFVIFH